MRNVAPEGFCPLIRANPKTNSATTTTSGKAISACHAIRRVGRRKIMRPAENSDSETHTTRNETP